MKTRSGKLYEQVTPSKGTKNKEKKDALASHQSNQTSMQNFDDRLVTCGICLDIMHNPASVSPCCHKFCSGCLYEWYNIKRSCPQCRCHINDMNNDPAFSEIVRHFLASNPGRTRDQATLRQLDSIELKNLEAYRKFLLRNADSYQEEETYMEIDVDEDISDTSSDESEPPEGVLSMSRRSSDSEEHHDIEEHDDDIYEEQEYEERQYERNRYETALNGLDTRINILRRHLGISRAD